ncbi:tRNA (adenosine(37)-N6)-threonylcarbamoyltransferase complex ATPase subunit type 1 TsaE [Daejeonella sp.]|uniref:tRNA (adenosine(37)-N6)-threonylcarbamoyltransferase complex ATPase subunit type 1 TsaE n=1 Tax=Daejeonella sp. TaxID=2805397 RepID=UPI0030C62BB8
MEIRVQDIKELPDAAKQLLEFSSGEKIFLFEGHMGAGKTTFIKALCVHLGAKDSISSPTYSLVNEYESTNGKIFHFDFFRIKNETEAYDMGFEEYLYSGNYCFIEWPDKVEGLWPANYIEVVIDQDEGKERTIKARKV